jgi:membrane-bound acyltransferase YfiQ involved in biofilm formation
MQIRSEHQWTTLIVINIVEFGMLLFFRLDHVPSFMISALAFDLLCG